MKKNLKDRGSGIQTGRDIEIQMGLIQDKIKSLVEYFKTEMGNELHRNKLVLRMARCGKKGCMFCPHGPYWYRAVFNTKTKKWIFRYIGSTVKKADVRSEEVKLWGRYKFYDLESKRLRQDKAVIGRAYRYGNNGHGGEPGVQRKRKGARI